MEIFNFRSCKQKSSQSLDDFVTELRTLSKTYEFANPEAEILSQVIQHCSSSRLRKRALREPDKSLTEILTLGRSLELADHQAAVMQDDTVNSINRNKSWKPPSKHKPDMHAPKGRQPIPKIETQQTIARAFQIHNQHAAIVVVNIHTPQYVQQEAKFVIIVRNQTISNLFATS